MNLDFSTKCWSRSWKKWTRNLNENLRCVLPFQPSARIANILVQHTQPLSVTCDYSWQNRGCRSGVHPWPCFKNRCVGGLSDSLTWQHLQEFIPLRRAVHPCQRRPMAALIPLVPHRVSGMLSQMSNDTSQYSTKSENGRIDKDATLLLR